MARTKSSSLPPETNANDKLGKIVIYNTNSANFNMAADYSLKVEWADATTMDLPVEAKFDSALNQTVYAGGGDP